MKTAILSLILLASAYASAAQVEIGKYTATNPDSGTVANLDLAANGTLTFSVKALGMNVACNGNYKVEAAASKFNANLKCNSVLLPTVSVAIDIRNVSPESVRTEKGAPVVVAIDELGGDPNTFYLKKVN